MGRGERIRRARLSANMTQEVLAAAAGLHKRTVIRAEGNGPMKPETAAALSSVLGIELSSLDAGAADAPAAALPSDPLLAEILARGETVRWEGSPDRAEWERINHPRAWYAVHHAMSVACALMVPVYALCLDRSLADGNGPGAVLAALCIGASGWFAWRSTMGVVRHREKLEAMDRTRLVATDRALYREVADAGGSATLKRVAIEPWTTIRDRAAYVLWPWARVTEVGDGSSREFVVGVSDLADRLAGIRHAGKAVA